MRGLVKLAHGAPLQRIVPLQLGQNLPCCSAWSCRWTKVLVGWISRGSAHLPQMTRAPARRMSGLLPPCVRNRLHRLRPLLVGGPRHRKRKDVEAATETPDVAVGTETSATAATLPEGAVGGEDDIGTSPSVRLSRSPAPAPSGAGASTFSPNMASLSSANFPEAPQARGSHTSRILQRGRTAPARASSTLHALSLTSPSNL